MPRSWLLTAIVVGALTSSLEAQTTRPSTRPSSPPSEESDDARSSGDSLLAGPKVAVTDSGPSPAFGGQRGAAAAPRLPARTWFQQMRALELTETQRREVAGLIRTFQGENTSYRDGSGQRVQELDRRIRAARQKGEPISEEDRVELEKLRAVAPRVEAVQKEIWGLLTEEQQEELRHRLADAQEALRERRRDRAAEAMDGAMPEDGPRTANPLDELAQRRLRFLRSRQRKGRAGAGPTARERAFDFEEKDGG